MGEPVVDMSPARLLRSLPKAMAVETVQAMYGSESGRTDMSLRVQALATFREGLDGEIVYDVDPVVFDDLIEVRTGGDNAVKVLIENSEGLVHASFWPLRRSLSAEDVLAGWAETLISAADRPHVVTVEVNSLIEQSLTFDFGYGAYARDSGRLRKLTSQRFLEELRQQEQERVAALLSPERRRDPFRRHQSTAPTRSYTVSGNLASTLTPGSTWVAAHYEEPRANNEEPRAVALDAWIPTQRIFAWDGRRVSADRNGLDAEGNDPTTPGYSTDASCNCQACCDSRYAEAQEAEEYDEPEDDYYAEDDEG